MEGSHTGESIAAFLEEKLDFWKVVNKMTVVVSDSASNMLASMDYLPNHMKHARCINHIIQIVLDQEVLEKPGNRNVIYHI